MSNIINPYVNQEIVVHRKYVSHFGLSYLDLKHIESGWLKPKRTVLRKICGQINYGTIIAILGPQKSGKTTLLKCLSGRANEGIDSETQFYTSTEIPVRVVYLEKNIACNILLSMTIEESLLYSFCFRSHGNVCSEQRDKVVRGLLADLDLTEIAGLALQSCSSEEQIRAEIAIALSTLDPPNMIFMDEPLSQLDAVAIDNIIHLMKRLCRLYSIAFVCSIGQVPDSDILTTFDKLYVLSRGGLCIYEGSVDHLGLFLRESNMIITSKIETPIERLMKVASKPNQTTIRLANRTNATREEMHDMSLKYGTLAPNGIQTPMARASLTNLWLHLQRLTINKFRLHWHAIILSFVLIFGLTLALTSTLPAGLGKPDSCYNKTSNQTLGKLVMLHNVPAGIVAPSLDAHLEIVFDERLVDGNLRFIYISLIALTLFQMISCIQLSQHEIRVAVNEHRNGWVSINHYFLMKNVVELFVPLLNTLLYTLVAYVVTEQQLSWMRMLAFFFAFFIALLCAQSLGFVIQTVAVFNERYVTFMAVCAYIVLVLFSGFLVPLSQLGHFMQILANISFLKQSFELSILAIYGLGRCASGSFVLDQYGLDVNKPEGMDIYLVDSLIIIGYFFALRFIIFLILRFKSNKTTAIQRPMGEEEMDEHDYEPSDDSEYYV